MPKPRKYHFRMKIVLLKLINIIFCDLISFNRLSNAVNRHQTRCGKNLSFVPKFCMTRYDLVRRINKSFSAKQPLTFGQISRLNQITDVNRLYSLF